jgi:NitT/TauT family transport system permease protein
MNKGAERTLMETGRWRGHSYTSVRARFGFDVAAYGISFLIFLVSWQLFSDSFGVPELFPPPIKTFWTFQSLLVDGNLVSDAAASMVRIMIGLLFGSIAGTLIGLLMGSSVVIHMVLDPYVNFLRFISAIAWISIFTIWFGIGEVSKVSLIVYATAFTLILNTAAGVAAISADKSRAALCLGANTKQMFFWVTIPATVPYIITGIRLSLANSFLVIVVAEMVQADSGIGFLIMSGRVYLAPDIVFTGMIVLGFLGLLSDRALMLSSQYFLQRYLRHN